MVSRPGGGDILTADKINYKFHYAIGFVGGGPLICRAKLLREQVQLARSLGLLGVILLRQAP
jgi:hypothetical protein